MIVLWAVFTLNIKIYITLLTEGIIGGDGEYQDAYVIGVDIPLSHFTGKVIAIIHRFNDNEDKWVIAPISKTYTKKRNRTICLFPRTIL